MLEPTQAKSSLVQAGQCGREAEDAASRGNFELAVERYMHAAALFTEATRHTSDASTIQSLRLLAETHRNRAEELQIYLDAAKSRPNEGDGSALLSQNGLYSSHDLRSDSDTESDEECGSRTDDLDMVYARTSSPFGLSDPLLFVYTKMGEAPEYGEWERTLEGQNDVEEDEDHAQEIDEEAQTTWQKMLNGLERLMDILPVIPFASSPPGPSSPSSNSAQSVQQLNHNESRTNVENLRTQNMSVMDSFFIVPSASASLSDSIKTPIPSAASPTQAGQSSYSTNIVLDHESMSKEELQNEVKRLLTAVNSLRSENVALRKAQEEKESTRENEMLKESIFRFRQEVERQAQVLQMSQIVNRQLSKSSVGRKMNNPSISSVLPTNRSLRMSSAQRKPSRDKNEKRVRSYGNDVVSINADANISVAHLSHISPTRHSSGTASSSPSRASRPSGSLTSATTSAFSSHSAAAAAAAAASSSINQSSSHPSSSSASSSSSISSPVRNNNNSPSRSAPGSSSSSSPSSSSSLSILANSDMTLSHHHNLNHQQQHQQQQQQHQQQQQQQQQHQQHQQHQQQQQQHQLMVKKIKDLEEMNRQLRDQVQRLLLQIEGQAKATQRAEALELENQRQREALRKYDEKWQKLERSAREKLKQRKSLPRNASVQDLSTTSTSTNGIPIPSSSSSSSSGHHGLHHHHGVSSFLLLRLLILILILCRRRLPFHRLCLLHHLLPSCRHHPFPCQAAGPSGNDQNVCLYK